MEDNFSSSNQKKKTKTKENRNVNSLKFEDKIGYELKSPVVHCTPWNNDR